MAIGPPINMFQLFIIPRMSLDFAKPKITDVIPVIIKDHLNKIVFDPRASMQRSH